MFNSSKIMFLIDPFKHISLYFSHKLIQDFNKFNILKHPVPEMAGIFYQFTMKRKCDF